MNSTLNVVTAPKTDKFQIRINHEIKEKLEEIYSKCGMTFTDALNIFIQQSLNVQGLPLVVNADPQEVLRTAAITKLLKELQIGEDSVHAPQDWLSAEDILKELGENR